MDYPNVVTGQGGCHSLLIGRHGAGLACRFGLQSMRAPLPMGADLVAETSVIAPHPTARSDKATDQPGGRRPGIQVGRAMASA
jgi:hypothetical protein